MPLYSIIVSGTNVIRDTSLVTSIDEKKQIFIRINDKILKFPANFKSPFVIFSNIPAFLSPAATPIRQNNIIITEKSIYFKYSLSGGIINIDIIAAAKEMHKTICDLKKRAALFNILLISVISLKNIQADAISNLQQPE